MATLRIMLSVLLGIGISLYGQPQTKDPGAAPPNTTTTPARSTRLTKCTSKPSRPKMPGRIRELSLTRLKPSATTVGLDRFRINDSPNRQSPTLDEKPCRAYLFAPADSTLLYPLPKWAKSFSATGFSFESKDVKFMVRCDGKVLHESESLAVCPDKITPIDLDLPPGAREVELIVRGVPHNEQALSAWCNPMVYSETIQDRKLFAEEELKKAQAIYSPARYGLELKEEGCFGLGLPNTIFSGKEATYEVWVWPATEKQTGLIIWDGDDQHGRDRAILFCDGNIIVKGVADPPLDLISKDQLRTNGWNYITLTISDQKATLYLNGRPTIEYTGRIADMANSSAVFTGRGLTYGNYLGNQYRGLITDIRLWNRALSAKEVSIAYHRNPINPEGMIGRWNFEKGSPLSKTCKYQNSATIGRAKIIPLKIFPKPMK